jgi:hypothetical protein
MSVSRTCSIIFGLFVSFTNVAAFGNELIANGGFETGDLSGWNVAVESGSFPGSSFFALTGNLEPRSLEATFGAASGLFYASSDQLGPASLALLQSFTVQPRSAVILSFDMFVNDYQLEPPLCPATLDFQAALIQCGRVDILAGGADPFNTSSGVLRNLFLGADPGISPHPYTHYTVDLTSLVGAGGSFQIRFAEAANLDFFNLGIDNVSISANPIPEPVSGSLIVCGAAVLVILGRLRLKSGFLLRPGWLRLGCKTC